MPRRRSYFLKYMTMFFLWASATILATQAINISTSLSNAVQYIQKIIITSDGSNSGTTGIVLDGSGGNAFFIGTVAIGTNNFASALNVSGGLTLDNSWSCGGVSCKLILWPNNIQFNRANLAYIENTHTGSDAKLNFSVGTGQTPDILIDAQHNIGIGTATPANKLAVNGAVNIKDTLYIWSSVFFSWAPGCGISNTCWLGLFSKDVYSVGGDWSFLSGDVGIWYDVGTAAVSNNLYIAGNLGVGTNSPTKKFQINDYAWIGSDNSDITTWWFFLRLYWYDPWNVWTNYTTNLFLDYYNNGDVWTKSHNRKISNDRHFSVSYATGNYVYDEKFTVINNGNVGIGKTNPWAKLEVNGNIRLTTGGYLQAWTNVNQLFLAKNVWFVWINTDSPQTQLDVDGGINANLVINSNQWFSINNTPWVAGYVLVKAPTDLWCYGFTFSGWLIINITYLECP